MFSRWEGGRGALKTKLCRWKGGERRGLSTSFFSVWEGDFEILLLLCVGVGGCGRGKKIQGY